MNPTTPIQRRIYVFCDGGIGNRINALVSGIAIAEHFQRAITVYWPVNSWCGAAFADIFDNAFDVRSDALDTLAGKFSDAKMMLHDAMGAQFLQVPFESAYDYQSMEDFAQRGLPEDRDIFLYPAIIAPWIPEPLVHAALSSLQFTEAIQSAVQSFITKTLVRPFHGLHLRRTDLRVGLSDAEVMALVQRHPNEVFFVCSDDPQAEALACAHPHVHARTKTHHVEKKEERADWISLSKDQEGRVSYGNIERSRDAMIEGTIDLLILAHSQIVGFSGSTFQRMARLLGDAAPLLPIARPAALPYFSFTEMTQQIERQLIEPGVLLQVCQTMMQNGEAGQALELMRMGFERMADAQRPDIAHSMGVMLLNQNQPRQASLYFIAVLQLQTMRYSSWLHLAYAKTLLGETDQAKQALQQALTYRPATLTPSDAMLDKALAERFQMPVPPVDTP
jgi:tetratricopeptide (TPR) repeat protein